MKPVVDRDLCIGCGLCEETAPEVFRLGDDGLSYVIDEDPPAELADQVTEALEICPTAAITLE